MGGWHHQLDAHKFEQALWVDDGRERLSRSSPWGCKELTRLSYWTELNWWNIKVSPSQKKINDFIYSMDIHKKWKKITFKWYKFFKLLSYPLPFFSLSTPVDPVFQIMFYQLKHFVKKNHCQSTKGKRRAWQKFCWGDTRN